MDNAMVQDLLDNFVMKNEKNFDRVSNENPILYNAVIEALDFLSNRFGTSKNIPQKEVKVEEELPLKVGDNFIYVENPSIVFKVLSFSGDTMFFVDAEKGDNSFRFGTSIDVVSKNLEIGKLVKVEPKSAEEEIKLGDLFQDTSDDQTIFRVSDFNGNSGNLVDFVKTWDGNFAFRFDKDKVRQKVKNGDWKKVTELEVFDILYPKKETTSVTKTKKATLSKEIKELKEAIDGLEAVENFLEDDEKKELAELRKKLSDLQQKNS